MTGTNDVGLDLLSGVLAGSQIGERLGPSITQIRSRGVVPVLSTIPPIHSDDPARQAALADGVARTNAGIFRLARERNLPLINLWRALTGPAMIDQGISTDQLHLSIFGGELPSLLPGPATFAASVNFTDPALRYGANRRNLIWLKTLARLDRITG